MARPALSISDIMWVLRPTQWALRPTKVQAQSQCDIIRLNECSPLPTLHSVHCFAVLYSCWPVLTLFVMNTVYASLWFARCITSLQWLKWTLCLQRGPWGDPEKPPCCRFAPLCALSGSLAIQPDKWVVVDWLWMTVKMWKCCLWRPLHSQWLISHKALGAKGPDNVDK